MSYFMFDDSLARDIVHLVIGSRSDNDDYHFSFSPYQLVNNTQTGVPKLDFQKSRVRSCPPLLPSGFP